MPVKRKIKRTQIICICSLPSSKALQAWQHTILHSTIANSASEFIVVSPYSDDEIDITLSLLKKHRKFVKHVSLKKVNTPHILKLRLIELIKDFSGSNIDKKLLNIITAFMPINSKDANYANTLLGIHDKLTDDNLIFFQNIDDKNAKAINMLMTFDELLSNDKQIKYSWHHMMYDPAEVQFGQLGIDKFITHFIHDIPSIQNIYVNPFIIYDFIVDIGFARNEIEITPTIQKQYNFVFGLTAFTDERKHIVDILRQQILPDSEKEKFYYYYTDDKGVTRDTRIDYNDYIKQLSNSRATLVIPAYEDAITFSVHRFIESISQLCVPIVYRANYRAAFKNYPEIQTIIEKYLLINDMSELKSKLASVRNQYALILHLLLTSDYVKHISSLSLHQQTTQLMLDIS